MLIKVKRLLVIKLIFFLHILITILQSCNGYQKEKSNIPNKDIQQARTDSLTLVSKGSINDTLIPREDTLLIGDIHIVINETSNFLKRFKKTPEKFYYSDTERRDFFLLHDQYSKKYYLLGAENGGCSSCVAHVELISEMALEKSILPEEIQDTAQFKPHMSGILKYKILEFPFLHLDNKLALIEMNLKQAGFKLFTSKAGNKIYRRITEYTILNVFIGNNAINRITIQLNIDV